MAEDTKTCTRCGVEKPLDGFHRDKSKKDGRQTYCKACNAAWRQANPNYFTEWHAANREHRAEYQQANPHIGWESGYRRRARHYGHDIIIETFTREQLIDRYGDQCWHCGGEWTELDHWPVPVSRGGHHTLDNCKPSCASCNQQSWRTADRDNERSLR